VACTENGEQLEGIEADDAVPEDEGLFGGQKVGKARGDPAESYASGEELEAQQMEACGHAHMNTRDVVVSWRGGAVVGGAVARWRGGVEAW
jgi:hypothetical protein